MFTTLLILALAATPAQQTQATSAGSAAEVERVMRMLDADPPVAKVQKAALEHFSVTQDDMSGYRAAARLKALLPSITGSYTYDDGKLSRIENDRIRATVDPNLPQIIEGRNEIGRAYGASASWDLSSLVFDGNQLETYALVGIHEDVLKEVTRLYYTRQHNMLALALSPPNDARARAALMLRTREIEAMLDAMTGGAWSRMRKVVASN